MRKESREKNISVVLSTEKVDSSLFSYLTTAMRFIGSGVTGEKAAK